jgi:hypothetical protein
LAILFPTVLFGLYWKRVYSAPAILSILAGETTLIFLHFKLIQPGPFLPVILVMLAAFGVYLVAHLLLQMRESCDPPARVVDRPLFPAADGDILISNGFLGMGKRTANDHGIPRLDGLLCTAVHCPDGGHGLPDPR